MDHGETVIDNLNSEHVDNLTTPRSGDTRPVLAETTL